MPIETLDSRVEEAQSVFSVRYNFFSFNRKSTILSLYVWLSSVFRKLLSMSRLNVFDDYDFAIMDIANATAELEKHVNCGNNLNQNDRNELLNCVGRLSKLLGSSERENQVHAQQAILAAKIHSFSDPSISWETDGSKYHVRKTG